MSPKGVMTQRCKWSATYPRETVAMRAVSGVTIHSVATELWIEVGVLGVGSGNFARRHPVRF